MTVTTQLIGKLGGGGAPETAVTEVVGNGNYGPPAGWRKAAGVFTGQSTDKGTRMFNEWMDLGVSYARVNGGGLSRVQHASSTSSARSRGCASSNPNGGGVDGYHHTTHRQTRRGRTPVGVAHRQRTATVTTDRVRPGLQGRQQNIFRLHVGKLPPTESVGSVRGHKNPIGPSVVVA